MALALVLLSVLSLASAEESCAVAGNCPEDLEFDSDSGLGLLQAKALKTHHAMKPASEPVDKADFAKSAENAEYASYAIEAGNASKAGVARGAFVAGNAITAIVAKKALLADQALEAEQACEVDASLEDPEAKEKDDGANPEVANEDPYTKVCGGNKDPSNVADKAVNAYCAEAADKAANALDAMAANEAIQAGNASGALIAEHAEFAYFAKDAGAAIVAKSVKNSTPLTKKQCAEMAWGLYNISYDAATAVAFADEAYNAEYASKATYAFEANTSAGAENAFAAKNSVNAIVADEVGHAQFALEAESACEIDDSKPKEDEKEETADEAGADKDPYNHECGTSSDPKTEPTAKNAHCAGTATNAAFAMEAMTAKNAVAADDANNAMFAKNAQFGMYSGYAKTAIVAGKAQHMLSKTVCEEMSMAIGKENRKHLQKKLKEKDAAFGRKGAKQFDKKAMIGVAKLGGRFHKNILKA